MHFPDVDKVRALSHRISTKEIRQRRIESQNYLSRGKQTVVLFFFPVLPQTARIKTTSQVSIEL